MEELKPRRVDVRVIATTNHDLTTDVRSGRFRLDLYYRLSAVVIAVPPLRERKPDIPIIAASLLKGLQAELCLLYEPVLTNFALEALMAYPWPGNVRELKNALIQALLQAEGPVLEKEHFFSLQHDRQGPWILPAAGLLYEYKLDQTLQALVSNKGNVSMAAHSLKVARSTIYRRLARNLEHARLSGEPLP